MLINDKQPGAVDTELKKTSILVAYVYEAWHRLKACIFFFYLSFNK